METDQDFEAGVRTGAPIIAAANPGMTMEAAEALARQVMTAVGVKPAPAKAPVTPPAPRPVAPRLDAAALANASPAERSAAFRAHEKAMEAWLPTMRSYEEPSNEVTIAAHARLQELRQVSDTESDAVKVKRAMEREALMQTILANGIARL